jgi:hypothetical protein
MSYKDGYGLREKQHDGTEFVVGGFVQIPHVSTLPETFELPIPNDWIRTQTEDTCASESIGNLLSYINSGKIDALYAWILARVNNGYGVDDWGVDLKSIALSAVKVGSPLFPESPFHSDGDRATYAEISNWNLKALQPKAIVNKAGSAVEVQTANGMDFFDSVKATLYKLQTPIVIGIRWNHDASNPNVDLHSDSGFGHAVLVTGWTKDRLVILNSWGRDVGNAGYFYFAREIINHDVAIFGAWTLVDETPEKVKWLLDNGIYLEDQNWLLNITKSFILAMKRLLTIALDAEKKEKGTGVPPYPRKMLEFADAMARFEGFYKFGSRPKRNCNPINARYVFQYKSIGEDRRGVPDGQNGYAIFPDEATGWAYWHKVLYMHCTGKSPHYNSEAKKLGLANSGELNIYQYIEIFAPAHDSNEPKHYAESICEWVGISPYSTLKELI